MGKGKSTFSSRRRARKLMEKTGTKQSRPENYAPIARENALFEKYYRQLGICEDDKEFDSFLEACRSDLPTGFRFSTAKPGESQKLYEILEQRFLSRLDGLELDDGSRMGRPAPLTWYPAEYGKAFQISLSRANIRKSAVLKEFHQFLIGNTQLGNVSRQEVVSMIPVLLLDVRSDSRVIDLCAAPGSKTSQLIEIMHGAAQSSSDVTVSGKGDSMSGTTALPSGFIVANDMDNARCYLLVHQSLKRLMSPACLVTNHNAATMPTLYGDEGRKVRFDRVLADVPCSGDGTMRKNIDVWTKFTPFIASGLHPLQVRIAKRGVELLEPGGIMVYSTCSLNPIENEAVLCEVLQQFEGKIELIDVCNKLPGLKRKPGMSTWNVIDKEGNYYKTHDSLPTQPLKSKFPKSCFPPENAERFHLERSFRILHHYQDTGGFFVAVLRRLPISTAEVEEVEEVAATSEEVEDTTSMSTTPPPVQPKKRRRFDGYKEDPFIFVKPEDSAWILLRDVFGIKNSNAGESFSCTQLLCRVNESMNANANKRNMNYVNSALAEILRNCDQKRMKIINAGVRAFARVGCSGGDFRIAQDALPYVVPFISKRLVHIPRADMIALLTAEKSVRFVETDDKAHPCIGDAAARTELLELTEGSIIVATQSACANRKMIYVCTYRGPVAITAYVAKEYRIHLLRLLDYDTKAMEDAAADKRKAKARQASTQGEAGEDWNGVKRTNGIGGGVDAGGENGNVEEEKE